MNKWNSFWFSHSDIHYEPVEPAEPKYSTPMLVVDGDQLVVKQNISHKA